MQNEKIITTKRFRQVLQRSKIPDERAESKHNDRNHNFCSHGSGEKVQRKIISKTKTKKPCQKHNLSKCDKKK